MIYRAGVILLLLPLAAAQAEWGRLFYTPQQRAILARPASLHASGPAGSNTSALHYFNGEVHRPGAKPLRWIDGQLAPAKPPSAVKPGESWDAVSGAVYPAGRRPDRE
ncbi:MAG: hypothetical protein H6R07_157 [Proteobacteria bacterium]|nr:hypothetical protein [Pseudomonadota bacterium]